MDPIALATTISMLTGVCLKATATISRLQAKYKNQERTLKSMHPECAAICASLTQIQLCILRDSAALDHIQLQEIFDTIITGCRVLFTCLDHDLDSPLSEAPTTKSWKPWSLTKEAQTGWDQKKMQSYLADLRMQQGALILLNELLLMYVGSQKLL